MRKRLIEFICCNDFLPAPITQLFKLITTKPITFNIYPLNFCTHFIKSFSCMNFIYNTNKHHCFVRWV